MLRIDFYSVPAMRIPCLAVSALHLNVLPSLTRSILQRFFGDFVLNPTRRKVLPWTVRSALKCSSLKPYKKALFENSYCSASSDAFSTVRRVVNLFSE